jgi:hypothetical protein
MSDKADAMRHNAGIPDSWWEFALEYAVHIYNRIPLKRHKWKTPFEKVHKTKPSVTGVAAYTLKTPKSEGGLAELGLCRAIPNESS